MLFWALEAVCQMSYIKYEQGIIFAYDKSKTVIEDHTHLSNLVFLATTL